MAKQHQQNKVAKNTKGEMMLEQNPFNKTSLWFGFIIFISVLFLSGFLIYNSLNLAGTIFGGTAIIGGAVFFIKAASASKKKGE